MFRIVLEPALEMLQLRARSKQSAPLALQTCLSKIFSVTILGSIAVSISACAPQQVGSADIQRLERKLNDVRSFQAEQTAELSALQEEVRSMTGRLEQLEFRTTRTATIATPANTSRVENDRPAPTPVLPIPGAVTSQTPPPIVPLDTLEADEELAPHLDVQIARLFQDGLYFIRRGQYRQALPLFDQLGATAGGKEGHVQSLFWKAVCFDGMGNNREALAAYNSLIQNYPGSSRARLSLLRLASVFVRLGDTNTARLTLQKLIAEAPGTAEAASAQKKLQDL
jgi:TolA-binding protein